MMTDRGKVVERLGRVSYYFKSLLAVGWQGDADTYREHRESVNMAIALLKEQPDIVRCKDCIYHRYTNDVDCIPYCELIGCGYLWKDDEFCNRGKRR